MDEKERQTISYLEALYGIEYYEPTNKIKDEVKDFVFDRPGLEGNQPSSLVSAFNLGYEPFSSKEKFIANAMTIMEQNHEAIKDRIENGLDSNRKIATDGSGNPIFHTVNSGNYRHLNSTIHEVNRYLTETKPIDRIFFDLETVGDAFLNRNTGKRGIYDITEIAMINFHQNGKVNFEESFLSFSKLSNENESRLQRMIAQFEKDPYSFAKLSQSEQRQLVDLMRYSRVAEGDTNGFGLRLQSKTGMPILTHNEMVEDKTFKIFKANGDVNTNEIIRQRERMAKHMKDGIRSIQDNEHSVAPEESAKQLRAYLESNQNKQFVSYNGKVFDMPLIRDYLTDFETTAQLKEAKAKGASLDFLEATNRAQAEIDSVIPKSHLDLYRAAETYYKTVGDLAERVGDNGFDHEPNLKLQNLGKIAERAGNYKPAESGAHNALDDVSTLRKLTKVIMDHLSSFTKGGILPAIPEVVTLPQDMPKHVTEATLNQDGQFFRHYLKEGETLIANRALMGMSQYDPLSFVLKKEGDTSFPLDTKFDGYVMDEYGEGGKIISAEAEYKFNGFLDMKEESVAGPIKAAVLEDTRTGSLSFIVRTGPEAQDELTAILQENFYSNDLGYGDKRFNQSEIKRLAKERAKDRARNFYSTLFSNTDGGRGLFIDKDGVLQEKGSSGYVMAKRVYDLAEDAKGVNLTDPNERKALRERAEELLGTKKRADHFMLGINRYQDEAKAYRQFFDEADSSFNERIDDVLKNFKKNAQGKATDANFAHDNKALIKSTNEELRMINIERNFALSKFHSYVEDALDEKHGEKARKANVLRAQHKAIALIEDAELGKEFKVNLLNQGEAEKQLRNMLYSSLPKDNDNKSHASDVAARINSMTNAIHNAGYIPESAKIRIVNEYVNAPMISTNEYIRDIVDTMRSSQGEKGIRKVRATNREQAVSLSGNHVLKNGVLDNVLQEMVDSSITQAKSVHLVAEIHEELGDSNRKYVRTQLPEAMTKYLDFLDREREHSVLKANNKESVERVLNELIKQYPNKSILTRIDRGEGGREPSINFTVMEREKSAMALNSYHKGDQINGRVFEMNMPLINEAGYMRQGGMRVNANMFTKGHTTLDGKSQIRLASSMELLTDDVIGQIQQSRQVALSQKPDARKQAEQRMANVVNKTMQRFAGRVAGAPVDNGQEVIGNSGDFAKQNLVKFDGAIVRDILDGNYNQVTLRPEPNSGDFRRSAYTLNEAGDLILKDNVTELDLSLAKQDEIQAIRADWWEERKAPEYRDVRLSIGATKSSQAVEGLSAFDTKEFYPKGLAYSTRRDPLVQALQAVPIQGALADRLGAIDDVSLTQSYMSQKQFDMMGSNRIPDAFEVRAVYMTNDQMAKRMQTLFNDESMKDRLKELDIFTPANQKLVDSVAGMTPEEAWAEAKVIKDGDIHYKLNYSVLPNMYEQQAGVSADLYNALQIQNNKTYSTKGRIEYDRKIAEGAVITPGQQIGFIIDERNQKEPLLYEGKYNATVGLMTPNKVNVSWEEQAFKIFGYGEKMTIQPVDQEVMDIVTGQKGVKVIHGGDIFRHEEAGHFLNMQMHSIAKEVAAEGNAERKAKMIEAINNAQTGDIFNQDFDMILDRSYQDGVIKPGEDIKRVATNVHNLVEAVDEQGNRLFPDTFNRRDIAIGNGDFATSGVEQIRIAHLYNTSKIVDDSTFKVIGENQEGRITNRKHDGVSFSTREIMSLRGLGLDETIHHIESQLGEKTNRVIPIIPNSKLGITFKQEASNLVYAANALLGKDNADTSQVLHYNLDDFNTHLEPGKGDYSTEMFKGSPFDGSKILKDASEQGKLQHGYYLNLPAAQDIENGKVVRESLPFVIDEKGNKTTIDKVFIPVRHLTDTNGQTFLDELGKATRNIINRAREVQESENYEDRAVAVQRMSEAVGEYRDRLKFDLTSSKGYVSENMVKSRLANSASGTYKLMDPSMSRQFQKEQQYDGEFTIIHQKDAERMGIFDGMSAEERQRLIAGDEALYGMHMRSPAFHPGAIQPVRLFIDEDGSHTRPGEFRTSTLASIIKNADSDGDVGFMFTVKDEAVQKEWADFNAAKEANFERHVDKYMKEINVSDAYQRMSEGKSGDSIRDLLGEGIFTVEHDNTKAEVVAKTWKSIVGIASDINYEAKQFISFGLDSGMIQPQEAVKMNAFYDIMEQKIINSKHGAEGVAAQMLNHLKSGRFGEFEEVANRYYGELVDGLDDAGQPIQVRSNIFNLEGELDEVRKRMPTILENFETSNEAKASIVGTRFGTSTGVRAGTTLEEVASILLGEESAVGKYSETNHFIRSVQNLTVGNDNVARMQINPTVLENTELRSTLNITEQALNDAALSGESLTLARHNAEAGARQVVENAEQVAKSVTGSSKKSMLIGAGLAMGGLFGYNIAIGNGSPPAMSENRSQQYQQIYGSSAPEKDTINYSQNYAPGEQNYIGEYEYASQNFGGHRVEGKQRNQEDRYNDGQAPNAYNAQINIAARGANPINAEVSQWINDAIANAEMGVSEASINLTTTDNIKRLNRVWYRDQVDRGMQ